MRAAGLFADRVRLGKVEAFVGESRLGTRFQMQLTVVNGQLATAGRLIAVVIRSQVQSRTSLVKAQEGSFRGRLSRQWLLFRVGVIFFQLLASNSPQFFHCK